MPISAPLFPALPTAMQIPGEPDRLNDAAPNRTVTLPGMVSVDVIVWFPSRFVQSTVPPEPGSVAIAAAIFAPALVPVRAQVRVLFTTLAFNESSVVVVRDCPNAKDLNSESANTKTISRRIVTKNSFYQVDVVALFVLAGVDGLHNLSATF